MVMSHFSVPAEKQYGYGPTLGSHQYQRLALTAHVIKVLRIAQQNELTNSVGLSQPAPMI